jgi:cytochrome o ubiquinol oxidase subunit 2
MSRNLKAGTLIVLCVLLFVIAAIYLRHTNIPVLQPAGIVGQKERDLMYLSLLLSVIVVVPVFILLFAFSWKYSENNTKRKKYQPDWDGSKLYESIWWAIPFLIIAVLAVITWNSSHNLDPFKPLSARAKPVEIQVIALDWRWLFIYPEQNLATLNFMQFPVNTPVNFKITSDAPMNSFWIPQLGSQIYAMPGMSTSLHLMAARKGDYQGKSANISGEGFARMTFTARASSGYEFNKWVNNVKKHHHNLTKEEYDKLAQPSQNNSVSFYSSADSGLYGYIIGKYISPNDQGAHEHGMAM